MNQQVRVHKRKFSLGLLDYCVELGDFYNTSSPYILLSFVDGYANIVVVGILGQDNGSMVNKDVWKSLNWGSGKKKDSPAKVLLDLVSGNIKSRLFRKGTLSESCSISFKFKNATSGLIYYDLYANDTLIGTVGIRTLGLSDLLSLLKNNIIPYDVYTDYTSIILNNFSTTEERNRFYQEVLLKWSTPAIKSKILESR